MKPEAVVRDFCAAIARRDAKELATFFTEDAVYHNIPVAPVRGRQAIEATLRVFLEPASEAKVELRGVACRGSLVFTERVDRSVINGKMIEAPVMGVFEVTTEGKIAAWRDYFDMGMIAEQLGAELASQLEQALAQAARPADER